MQQGSTPAIASFTGTLLRREHTLGQKFVQLVFRENDQNVLCVSTDTKNAALLVGQAYRVEGALREKSGRSFIQDPRITQLKKHWSLIKRVVVGIVVVGVLAGLGGTAFALRDHSAPASVPLQTPQVAKPAAEKVTAVTPASAPAVQPAPAPAAPATHAVVTAVRKINPRPVTLAQTTPTAPAVSPIPPQQTAPAADPGTPAASGTTASSPDPSGTQPAGTGKSPADPGAAPAPS